MKGTTVLVLVAAVAIVAATPVPHPGQSTVHVIDPGPGFQDINVGPEIVDIVPGPEPPVSIEIVDIVPEEPIVVDPFPQSEEDISGPVSIEIVDNNPEAPIVVDPEVDEESPIVVDPSPQSEEDNSGPDSTETVDPESPIVVDPDVDEESPIVVEPEPESEEEFLPNGCPIDPHIHWLLPDEQDCNKFYACVWGEKVPRQCAASLHFNRHIQVCDWPSEAGCAA